MSLEQLWAGWRANYVASVADSAGIAAEEVDGLVVDGPGSSASTAPDDGTAQCVFCRILASGAPDEDRRVVHVGARSAAILNAYPYASGHLLVLPLRHVSSLSGLDPEEAAEVWETTRRAVAAVEGAYRPDGVNLGANLGRAAGAGIPAHLHLHVVPRWLGDTNFMTSVAETRVLPESLGTSWTKLRAAWAP